MTLQARMRAQVVRILVRCLRGQNSHRPQAALGLSHNHFVNFAYKPPCSVFEIFLEPFFE
jgi:hypothetical protein